MSLLSCSSGCILLCMCFFIETNNSNNIKTEEDDKKLMASPEVPAAAIITSSIDHQTEKQEMLTDSAADIMASVLKSRKRGRPRKFGNSVARLAYVLLSVCSLCR